MLFPLSSPPRLRSASVVFDFSTSHNDVVPVSPILLPVYWSRKKLIVYGLHFLLFLLCSPLRSSSVSVVFDFNASLIDVAPVSPILFPVDLMRMKKHRTVDKCHLRVVSFVFTTKIEFCECCV